jgi:hypothetical protein
VADNVLADEARRFGGTFFVKPVEPKRMLEAIGENPLIEEEFSDAILGQPFAGFGGVAPKPA